MVGTSRSDKCPRCGKNLRWIPPTEWASGMWSCPKCKYKRMEGSARNIFHFLKRKKKKVKQDG